MPRHPDFQLDPEQLDLLQEAIAIAFRPLDRLRAQGLLLLYEGCSPRHVAEVLHVRVSTVYLWRQRWREAGLGALHDRPRSGRPPKSDAGYRLLLEQALAHDPDLLGFDFITWTVERLCAYMLHQTGIHLSDRRMRALLKRLGYSYTIYRHARPNPYSFSRRHGTRTRREEIFDLIFSERVQWVFTWKKA